MREVTYLKKRVGLYVKNLIKYERLEALEDRNSHSIVIDVMNGRKGEKRIINIYRSFNPIGETSKDLFLKRENVKMC